jgi:putative spermidine/putrescine transport system permease protein
MSALAKKIPRFAPYVGLGGRLRHYSLLIFSCAVIIFLMTPVLVIIPLAFNADPYFTYPINKWSVKWFVEFFTDDVWRTAVKNSFTIAMLATLICQVGRSLLQFWYPP